MAIAIPKTMLNVKVDVDLKKAAQNFANEVGLPLSTVVSNAISNIIESGKVIFTPRFTPGAHLASTLDDANKNKNNREYWDGPFDSVDGLMADLQK